MNFNEILVEIMLSDKNDGSKDIDWLYGEYVRRGYEKSKEKFYEEIVKSMGEQELSDLTELEETEVVGGAGKLKNRSVVVALAGALLAGTLMPSQQAQARRQEETNTTYLSSRKKETSTQGIADKAKKIVNKFLNDEDTRKILLPTLTTLGIGVGSLAAVCIITKFVNYILEAKTPSEVIERTVEKIKDTLSQSETAKKKQKILVLLDTCLTKLLEFVKTEERDKLKSPYTEKFGTDKKPNSFDSLEEIYAAFTTQLTDIIQALQDEYNETDTQPLLNLLQSGTFKGIFGTVTNDDYAALALENNLQQSPVTQEKDGTHEKKKEDKTKNEKEENKDEKMKEDQPPELKNENDYEEQDKHDKEKDERAGENIEEETKRKATEETDTDVLLPNCNSIFDSGYDVNKQHDSYTTDELKDNNNVSKETGIDRTVLDVVDKAVKENNKGAINCFNLTKDTMLAVCKHIHFTNSTDWEPLKNELQTKPGTKLYLVLENCTIEANMWLPNAGVAVLDLRGTTVFNLSLCDIKSIDKILLRNNNVKNIQLSLLLCQGLGEIFQLSEDNRNITVDRLLLTNCHLDGNFKFINLNSCCTKQLRDSCLIRCTCPATSLPDILDNFEHSRRPRESDLYGV